MRLFSRLPFWVLYGASDVFYVFVYYVVRYRRTLVRTQLQRAFPEKALPQLKKIEKEFYRNLCDYGVECIKAISISKEELSRRMVCTNPDVIEHYKAHQQPVVFLAAHAFNWEWLLMNGSYAFSIPVDFVFQKVSSSFFHHYLLHCRSRFGAHAIEREQVARESIRRHRTLRILANVADQFPGHEEDKRIYLTFLHQRTAFFYGVDGLIEKLQYPVFFVAIKKVKRGFYTYTFVEQGTPPYQKDSSEVMKKFAEQLEKLLQENPANWLWSHNRWKKRYAE